jgi:biotin carboxyl carrier protein
MSSEVSGHSTSFPRRATWKRSFPFENGLGDPMRYFVTVGRQTLEVELGADGVRVDGIGVNADLMEMDGTEVRSLLLDGKSHRILASRKGRGLWSLHLAGRHVTARVVDERTRSIEEMTGDRDGVLGPEALRAPMPGMVVKVEVEEGQPVMAGQGLVIVEAMKMENELKSPGDVRVKKILVAAGEAVEKDQVLIELDPLEDPGKEGIPA